MKGLIIVLFASLTFQSAASAGTTIYQCAVDTVVPQGARVNIVENNGAIRANLIFGTTVSGTMYDVTPSPLGYSGTIRNKANFDINLAISTTRAKNSNIEGFKSHLKAVYPTLQNRFGYDVIDVDLVCGQKISNRWN